MNRPPAAHRSAVQNLISAFDLLAGRVRADVAFDFSSQAFWQAVLASWGLGMLMVLPFVRLGAHFFAVFAASSLISLLVYALAVWHILVWSGRHTRYLHFIIPFFWLNALQIVLFGLLSVLMQATGMILLQLLMLPVAIWVLICQFRLAREQLSFGTLPAIAIVFARFFVELVTGLLGGMQTSLLTG